MWSLLELNVADNAGAPFEIGARDLGIREGA